MEYSSGMLALLHNSIEYERLHHKLHRFNPLKILRVDKFEIRHSNVISWLLDPNENHRLGSFFIQKLLSRILVKSENENLLEAYNLMSFMNYSFHDLEVLREVQTTNNKRIDILAVSERNKCVFLIENKYKSSESAGQLNNYLMFVQEQYHDYTIIPLFLTLDSTAPTNTAYFVSDYNDVLDILQSYLFINKEHIHRPVFDFLTYYMEVLEEELTRDEDDIELALDIYKEHKQVIDFLYASNNSTSNNRVIDQTVLTAVKQLTFDDKAVISGIYVKNKETINFIFQIGNSVLREAFLSFAEKNHMPENLYKAHIKVPHFILPEWKQLDEVIGTPKDNWWLNNALIIWFERTWNERIKLTIEVGPLEHTERLSFLTRLEENGLVIRSSAKQSGAMYTKIYTAYKKVANWADKEELASAMESLVKESHFKKTETAIAASINYLTGNEDPEEEAAGDGNSPSLVFKNVFQNFIKPLELTEACYNASYHKPSFILPEFKALEKHYGKPFKNWWLNNCLIMWFEKMYDGRMKFIIEVGPLESARRIVFLQELGKRGIAFQKNATSPSAMYSKIHTLTIPVDDWSDEQEISSKMTELYTDQRTKTVINSIIEHAEELSGQGTLPC